MTTPGYIKNLTPVERGAAIKLGMAMSLASNGVTPEQFRKQAAWGQLDLIPKSFLVASLLAGIPLGVVAHAVGRSVATDNRKEREAIDRLRYYQRLTSGIESGLAQEAKDEQGTPANV